MLDVREVGVKPQHNFVRLIYILDIHFKSSSKTGACMANSPKYPSKKPLDLSFLDLLHGFSPI